MPPSQATATAAQRGRRLGAVVLEDFARMRGSSDDSAHGCGSATNSTKDASSSTSSSNPSSDANTGSPSGLSRRDIDLFMSLLNQRDGADAQNQSSAFSAVAA